MYDSHRKTINKPRTGRHLIPRHRFCVTPRVYVFGHIILNISRIINKLNAADCNFDCVYVISGTPLAGAGEQSSESGLTMSLPSSSGSGPRFVANEWPSDVTFTPDRGCSIECSVWGQPAPHVAWLTSKGKASRSRSVRTFFVSRQARCVLRPCLVKARRKVIISLPDKIPSFLRRRKNQQTHSVTSKLILPCR